MALTLVTICTTKGVKALTTHRGKIFLDGERRGPLVPGTGQVNAFLQCVPYLVGRGSGLITKPIGNGGLGTSGENEDENM